MVSYFIYISIKIKHTIEGVGEGHRASPKKRDKCDPKPIWVHAWKVNHGGDFLNTTIDGDIGSKIRDSFFIEMLGLVEAQSPN